MKTLEIQVGSDNPIIHAIEDIVNSMWVTGQSSPISDRLTVRCLLGIYDDEIVEFDECPENSIEFGMFDAHVKVTITDEAWERIKDNSFPLMSVKESI